MNPSTRSALGFLIAASVAVGACDALTAALGEPSDTDPLLEPLFFRAYPDAFQPISVPAVDEQRVYLTSLGSSAIIAASIVDGTERWRSPETSEALRPRYMVVQGGTLLYAAADAVARDAATGHEQWRVPLPASGGNAVHVATDSTFIVAAGRTVRALRITDGSTQWLTTIAPDSVARDWFAHGSTLAGGVLYSMWTEFPTNGLPSVAHVAAISPRTGEVYWHNTTLGDTPRGPPAVWGSVLLYPLLSSPDLVALHRVTGAELYRLRNRAPTSLGSLYAPKIVGDTAIYGTGDGFVKAFHPATGETIWETEVGSTIHNIQPCGSVVLVLGGDLAVLNRRTGAILQRVASEQWGGPDREPLTYWARQGNRAYAGTPFELIGIRCPR